MTWATLASAFYLLPHNLHIEIDVVRNLAHLVLHVPDVEHEEIVLLKQFREEVAAGKVAVESEQIAEQESNRIDYERRLAGIRDRRARFRGLLYDAIQERSAIVKAHLQRHGIILRAREKLDYWRDRSGLDKWLVGFFIASVAIVVCYIVFLTFPVSTTPLTPTTAPPPSRPCTRAARAAPRRRQVTA